MYKELLDKYEELKKKASPEEFEQECECILKEAGLGSLLLKGGGKLGLGLTKSIGNLGAKMGAYAIKKPGKAIGMGLGGAYLATGVKNGFNKAKNELNQTPNIEQIPIQERPKQRYGEEKIARDNNNNKQDEIGNYKYLPYIASGAAASLLLAEAIKKRDIKQPLKTLGQGGREAAEKILSHLGKKNPVTRTAINASRKAAMIGKQRKAEILDWFRTYQNIPWHEWNKLSKEELDSIVDWYLKKYPKGNGPVEFKRLGVDWKKIKKSLKKHTPGVDQLNKGLGAGATFGLSNFAIHALGDEYFKRKDKDELRRILRESYEDDISDLSTMKKLVKNPDSVIDNTYKTPKQKARELRRENKVASIKKDIMEKVASDKFNKFKNTAKEIIKEDVLKNMKRSLIFTGAPIAAGTVINRNLKHDFSKLKSKDNDSQLNSNRVIIEVPLEDVIKKRADFSDKDISKIASKKKASKIFSKKVLNKIKGEAKDTARQGIRAISWTAAPTAVVALTGRNMRGNLEKMDNQQLGPVEPGKARIIIETNKGGNNSNSAAGYYYATMGKRASEQLEELYKEATKYEKAIKKDIKNIANIKEQNKDKANGQKKLMNFKMTPNVKKKDRLLD